MINWLGVFQMDKSLEHMQTSWDIWKSEEHSHLIAFGLLPFSIVDFFLVIKLRNLEFHQTKQPHLAQILNNHLANGWGLFKKILAKPNPLFKPGWVKL